MNIRNNAHTPAAASADDAAAADASFMPLCALSMLSLLKTMRRCYDDGENGDHQQGDGNGEEQRHELFLLEYVCSAEKILPHRSLACYSKEYQLCK